MSFNLKYWCYAINLYFVNKFRVIPKIRERTEVRCY